MEEVEEVVVEEAEAQRLEGARVRTLPVLAHYRLQHRALAAVPLADRIS